MVRLKRHPVSTGRRFFVSDLVNVDVRTLVNMLPSMYMDQNKTITVEVVVRAPMEKVWKYWTDPSHITKWCFASDTWEAPKAENDLRTGGRFLTTMAAKDKSASFDFTGTYTAVEDGSLIEYTMDGDDHRKVQIHFAPVGDGVRVTESFEMEAINPREMQQSGWQSILDNFKTYVENN